MKVIIYGATGGIGKWAVKHALDKGYDVTAFVRNAKKLQPQERLVVVEGKINDPVMMKSALSGQDAVLWCVGIPMKRKYEKMESLEGHRVLLDAMKENGVKRIIDWGTPSVPFEKRQKVIYHCRSGNPCGNRSDLCQKRDVRYRGSGKAV